MKLDAKKTEISHKKTQNAQKEIKDLLFVNRFLFLFFCALCAFLRQTI